MDNLTGAASLIKTPLMEMIEAVMHAGRNVPAGFQLDIVFLTGTGTTEKFLNENSSFNRTVRFSSQILCFKF